MKRQKRALDCYLNRVQQLKIKPNFYLSMPYLTLNNAKCWEQDGWLWLEADKWCLFPPLPVDDEMWQAKIPVKRVWSDFETIKLNQFRAKFLDWEYIFDPLKFNDLSGGAWESFRKNCRKWPKAHPDWLYTSHLSIGNLIAAGELVIAWLEAKGQTVQDAEFIAKYTLSPAQGQTWGCLFDNKTGELMAINAWDENWLYVNFRFCIIKPGQPYLDEFARWLFYTDKLIQAKNKLINDGGVLGSPGLERFKDKLNPLSKRKVMSWLRK
jgi:hypothetical protein